MSQILHLSLSDIQPSQLYISTAKLAQVCARWSPPRVDRLTPIPVVLLDGVIVATDGHTRGLAAYLAGFSRVPAYWDPDDLDRQAYRICVDWCRSEGIRSLPDLADRLLTPEAYDVLWLGRCRRMHRMLAQTGIS